MWIPSKRTGQNNVKVLTSVVDLVTLNLDPDPGFWPSLDPDPRLYYQFERKKLKIILEQYFGSGSVQISIKKCHLDPGFWPGLDPDPRLYYKFERKNNFRAVFWIRIRTDQQKEMPPRSGSARTDADPDSGDKKSPENIQAH